VASAAPRATAALARKGFPSKAPEHADARWLIDHVTIYRWVQRFTPLLIDAA
jgi:hypothetical protein